MLLALDADSAGQEAMLRAAGLAAKRKLELRVVPAPAGTDPAELVQSQGAEAIERAVRDSVPFVRFRVERVLDDGDHGSPEGRDRMLDELRPVFATLPPERAAHGADAHRLRAPAAAREPRGADAGESRRVPLSAEVWRGRRPGGPSRASRPASVTSRGESTERAFLAQCIAEPESGARALGELDLDAHFTSDLLRRAAGHLSAHLADPGAQLPEDDPELSGLLAELVVQAGRESPAPAMLESQRMQLELARIDREIVRARGRSRATSASWLCVAPEVKREFDRAYERALEETG